MVITKTHRNNIQANRNKYTHTEIYIVTNICVGTLFSTSSISPPFLLSWNCVLIWVIRYVFDEGNAFYVPPW